MKQRRNQRNESAITLIALVITIIVMLILVAVTINIVANGKLFNYARDAKEKTNLEIAKEQMLAKGEITVDGKTYASLEDYLAGKEKLIEIHNWTRGTGENRDVVTCKCSICTEKNPEGVTYQIGQTIPYKPNTVFPIIVSREIIDEYRSEFNSLIASEAEEEGVTEEEIVASISEEMGGLTYEELFNWYLGEMEDISLNEQGEVRRY